MNTFYVKPHIYTGNDSVEYLHVFSDKTIWIICDGFLVGSGGLDYVKKQLKHSNRIEIYDNVIPDPPLDAVISGIQRMRGIKPDIVIALGGGSAIDTAKGILYFAKKMNLADVEQFIAIPTTSGTGSEVTSVTVITDTREKIKYPLKAPEITPDVAILDPAFTLSIPHDITANTGIDVLTHAIEAYVSKNATLCSDAMAEKSVQLVIEYLPKCCQELRNPRFREIMHEASTMAGMAFDIAGLGITHSIAHQIGAQFHVPHGMANAMLLPHTIRFNSGKDLTASNKYAYLARLTGIVNNLCPDFQAVHAMSTALSQLLAQLGIPCCLTAFGLSREDVLPLISSIAEQALRDICMLTNPCGASTDDVVQIINYIL